MKQKISVALAVLFEGNSPVRYRSHR